MKLDKKNEKIALAVAATLGAGAAQAATFPATLVQWQIYSNNGTNNPNLTSSTATWQYDDVTGLVTQTGGTLSVRYTTAPTSTLFRHTSTGLVIGAGAAAMASTYSCVEGNFGAGVGASICGNYNFGANFTNESTLTYSGTSVTRVLGGDDTSAGNPQSLSELNNMTDTLNGTSLVLTNGVCNLVNPANCTTIAGNPLYNKGFKLTFQVQVPGAGVALDDVASTAVDTPVVIDALANDSGFVDPLTVTVPTPPSAGSVSISGSPGPRNGIILQYTPASGFKGTDSFQYTVGDSYTSKTATVTVSVGTKPTYYPSGPQTGVSLSTITSGGWQQCYSAYMGTPLAYNAQDVLAACQGPEIMMAGRQTGSSNFLVAAAASRDEATTDTGNTSATHLANGSKWYFSPGRAWGFTAAADEVILSTCDYTSSPTSMCLYLSGGSGGYRINDLTGLYSSDYEKVFFTGGPPGPRNDATAAYLSVPVSINVLGNDFGLQAPVSVDVATPPQHGTATVTGSPGDASSVRISYKAEPGFKGTDTFEYAVNDGVTVGTAQVSVEVRDFVAANDDAYVLEYSSVYMYVAKNDLGFTDPVSLSIITNPTGGYAYLGNTPAPKASASLYFYSYNSAPYTTSFTYQVSDGTHTDQATATIHVVKFIAVDDEAKTGADAPVVIPVTQNDVGFGSPRTVGIYTNPQHGTVRVNGNGDYYTEPTITYTPAPGYLGDDSFEYAIDDGTRIDRALVTVHVVADADNDLVEDALDNCINVANTNQRDTDGDGYGNVCDGDLNNDGRVNFTDLALFRTAFGTSDPNADFDGNGVVNFGDLARFKSLFGLPPGPSGLK